MTMQLSQRLFAAALSIIAVLFLLQVLAFFKHWYELLWWFDDIMHTLGGMFIALAGTAAYVRYACRVPSISTVLLMVAIVGIGWEAFEYIWQALLRVEGLATPLNSVYDMIADMVGGFFGVIFVQNQKKRYNSNNAI